MQNALRNPVEIVVGGRAKVSNDIEQFVEVRDPNDKFPRLLQLLGLWYEKGNVLVFVDTQTRCDQLFQQLTNAGYPCLSLHGGKDQVDRDYTIKDFKDKFRTLMVATSVAGRGLDVPELVLVINYNCPNHIEDYVHRVGRTGRAGKKGTSYTFVTPSEAQFSPDLVKALTQAKQKVSPELQAMFDAFSKKYVIHIDRLQCKRGHCVQRYHGSTVPTFNLCYRTFPGSNLARPTFATLAIADRGSPLRPTRNQMRML